MSYRFRRHISLGLAILLIFTSLSTSAFAASGQQQEEYKLAGPVVKKLPSSRLETFEGQEALYFGTATADLTEGDAYYSIPVCREGDLETEATVSLLTLDVSALYGTDYELCLDDVYTAGQTQTLLEKGNGQNNIVSDAEAEELMEEMEEQAESEEEQAGLTAAEEETDTEENSGSGLGSITKSIFQNLDVDIDTEFGATDEQMQEALTAANLDYSAGVQLTFKKGESEKTVTFRIMDDGEEEGQEMFMFALADAEGTEVKEQSTFTAVINDDEELHDALISFSQSSYTSEDGKVTVTVNRTGSLYSLIDFYLQSEDGTALDGENFAAFDELLNMQPYQSSATYTFDVCGEGSMKVLLVPCTSCAVEGSDSADIVIRESDGSTENAAGENGNSLTGSGAAEEEIDALSGSTQGAEEPEGTEVRFLTEEELEEFGIELAEGEKSFPITIGKDSTNYCVKYTGDASSVTVGGIYKKGYETAAARVGDYIFVAPKTTEFGYHTGDPSTAISEYQNVEDDAHKSRGYVYWYSRLASDEGDSSLNTKSENTLNGFTLGSTYYRNITPDWQGLYWAGFHQTYEFEIESVRGNISRSKKWSPFNQGAEFSRTVDLRFRMYLPVTMDNTKLKLRVKAIDRSAAHSKVGIYVYGFVCMYKAWDITVSGFEQKSYRTANGEVKNIPFRLELKAGVGHTYAADEYRTVYADTTGEQNKVVFSASDVYLNGHSGQYGYITGYTMTYNADGGTSKKFKTVTYPADFYSYLRNQAKNPPQKHDYIDYSSTAVEARIAQDEGRKTILNFDAYLIDWLTSLELSLEEGRKEWDDQAVKLSFQPIVEYYPVTVIVQDPDQGSCGKFTKLGTGTYKNVYHAGDELNLTAETTADGYIAQGYEYSVNAGKSWHAVTNENRFFLDSSMSTVYIRPLMTTVTNKIRIEYIGDAASYIEVDNVIPEEDLGKEYKGMVLIDANPAKKDITERARPTIGETFPITVYVTKTPEEYGYEYRPYFIDKMYSTTEHINSQVYPFVAKAKETDNVMQSGSKRRCFR